MSYRIRIQEHLDPSWQKQFGEFHFERQETGATLLSGGCRISQRSIACSYSSSGWV